NVHVWRRTVSGAVDFLTSINPNAYQEGTVGDTTIEYLGSLGDKARIEIGSYVGTGTDTSAVTISFKPSLVFLFGASNTMYAPIGKNSGTFSINYQYAGSSHGERSGTIKVNDNVVTVYYPFNDSGATYTIVAFK
ncbi:MAG: hypothetical protein MR419_00290, partial [Clostridiales bacterium]|nr:hypothetical protein [Clostridiales bacterium]